MGDCSFLPRDENLVKEYQELQEKIEKTANALAEKEKKFTDAQNQFGQDLRKCQQMKSDVEERAKLIKRQAADVEERINTEEAEVLKLEENYKREQQRVNDMENKEKELLEQLNKKNEQTPTVSEKLAILEHLSGITLNYLEGPVASFSISRKRTTTDESTQEIEVVLTFENASLESLIDVRVYPEKPTWSDLIRSALQREISASELLNSMQRGYRSVDGLEDEIEFLQSKYAIDWQPEQRLITVILPNEGQAMCRLQVDENYPVSQVIECTYTDELLKEKIASISQKVKEGHAMNLTQWLEHLHHPTHD